MNIIIPPYPTQPPYSKSSPTTGAVFHPLAWTSWFLLDKLPWFHFTSALSVHSSQLTRNSAAGVGCHQPVGLAAILDPAPEEVEPQLAQPHPVAFGRPSGVAKLVCRSSSWKNGTSLGSARRVILIAVRKLSPESAASLPSPATTLWWKSPQGLEPVEEFDCCNRVALQLEQAKAHIVLAQCCLKQRRYIAKRAAGLSDSPTVGWHSYMNMPGSKHMPTRRPERMPNRTSHRMSEYTPDRM